MALGVRGNVSSLCLGTDLVYPSETLAFEYRFQRIPTPLVQRRTAVINGNPRLHSLDLQTLLDDVTRNEDDAAAGNTRRAKEAKENAIRL